MLGIENYNPKVYNSLPDLINTYKNLLKRLIGKKISQSWVAWDENNNEWWSDIPIVLRIEDTNLEVCATRLDEFAISVNSINILIKPNWFDMDDILLSWQKDKLNEINNILNKEIKDIEITEYLFNAETVYSKDNPDNVGIKYSNWILSGIRFVFHDSYLEIYNGLDTNAVSNCIELGQEYRSTSIFKL